MAKTEIKCCFTYRRNKVKFQILRRFCAMLQPLIAVLRCYRTRQSTTSLQSVGVSLPLQQSTRSDRNALREFFFVGAE